MKLPGLILILILGSGQFLFSESAQHGLSRLNKIYKTEKRRIPLNIDLITLTFIPSGIHYTRSEVNMNFKNRQFYQEAWQNENVSAEILIQSLHTLIHPAIQCTDFKSINAAIDHRDIRISVLKNILSENSIGKCGNDNKSYDPVYIPDLLGEADSIKLISASDCIVYLSIRIPPHAKAGIYETHIRLKSLRRLSRQELIWTIKVIPRRLTDLSNSSSYLNIWQNPYSVSSYYNVKPWSVAHFKLLKPVMQMLAEAGQKCITASFFWNTFNVQSEGLDNAMIVTRKDKQGHYTYDYKHFDDWINFMISLGISKEIIVFGLDPWYPNYWYWDEEKQVEIKNTDIPGSIPYTSFWSPYLRSFAEHLKAKGWFDRVLFGLDERPAENIAQDINFLKSINSKFRVQVSGLYNAENEPLIDDYAVNSNQIIPDIILRARKMADKKTSYYTACWEEKPNTILFNQPYDAWFLPVHALAIGMDGFSRYSFNNWSKNNLNDARNKELPPGDAFFIYPGPLSSIRFEKLKEGILFTVKWKILSTEAVSSGNYKMKKALDKLLLRFKAFRSPDYSLVSGSISELNKW